MPLFKTAIAGIAQGAVAEFDSELHDRADSTETEIFEGGDHHVAGADFEADLAFFVCGVSF